MLNKQKVISELELHKSDIEKFGVNKVGLFGSYVREQQREDSDIDILIDFAKGQTTYDNFMAAYDLLEELFPGKKVSVVTMGGLSKFIGPFILKEVQYV